MVSTHCDLPKDQIWWTLSSSKIQWLNPTALLTSKFFSLHSLDLPTSPSHFLVFVYKTNYSHCSLIKSPALPPLGFVQVACSVLPHLLAHHGRSIATVLHGWQETEIDPKRIKWKDRSISHENQKYQYNWTLQGIGINWKAIGSNDSFLSLPSDHTSSFLTSQICSISTFPYILTKHRHLRLLHVFSALSPLANWLASCRVYQFPMYREGAFIGSTYPVDWHSAIQLHSAHLRRWKSSIMTWLCLFEGISVLLRGGHILIAAGHDRGRLTKSWLTAKVQPFLKTFSDSTI